MDRRAGGYCLCQGSEPDHGLNNGRTTTGDAGTVCNHRRELAMGKRWPAGRSAARERRMRESIAASCRRLANMDGRGACRLGRGRRGMTLGRGWRPGPLAPDWVRWAAKGAADSSAPATARAYADTRVSNYSRRTGTCVPTARCDRNFTRNTSCSASTAALPRHNALKQVKVELCATRPCRCFWRMRERSKASGEPIAPGQRTGLSPRPSPRPGPDAVVNNPLF